MLPGISAFSLFLNFVRFGPFKKCSRVFFRAFEEELIFKHVSHRPNIKFSAWPFLDFVTLNDLNLQYAHQKLRCNLDNQKCLRHDPCCCCIDLFPYDTIVVRDKARKLRHIVKQFDFDLTCDFIGDPEVNNLRFHPIKFPDLSKAS